MQRDSDRTMIEESRLTRCFEMLIERLDTIESRCERLERYMQNEQEIKLGRIKHLNMGFGRHPVPVRSSFCGGVAPL